MNANEKQVTALASLIRATLDDHHSAFNGMDHDRTYCDRLARAAEILEGTTPE